MGQRSSKPKSRLLSKPRRIADETFAQPVVEHASRIQVTSLMTVSELVACLVKKGCSNITDQLDLAECSEYPISGGGFGDVYRGRLKNGDRVAIKTMRLSVSSNGVVQNSLKNAARELYTWSKCEHDNIQRLLGLVEFRGQVGMVSPWQPNGNLHQYLERYPETDRYEMSTQISDGLAYLHRTNIVHGDLKGLNILISKAGSPLLADFGNSFLRECTLKFTDTSSKHLVSLRWAAPELLGGTAKHNTRTDVYALGMVSRIGVKQVNWLIHVNKLDNFGASNEKFYV
ncbi:hypothetical protein FRC12_004892 [Ceratobasidium sp. 428]|nr:hypothetical protein FRC12_004892 [Ceratobasidium sp. 428]